LFYQIKMPRIDTKIEEEPLKTAVTFYNIKKK